MSTTENGDYVPVTEREVVTCDYDPEPHLLHGPDRPCVNPRKASTLPPLGSDERPYDRGREES